jgi:hypothetical protein
MPHSPVGVFICAMIDSFEKGVRYETGATNPPQKRLGYL